MFKKRILILISVVLMLALFVGCSEGDVESNAANGDNNENNQANGSEDVITLEAAHYFESNHPWNQGLEYFAERANELSDGRIEIEIYNNGVLGSETDMLQSLREGTLDFAVSDPSAGAGFAKELDFFALPFLFDNYEHWEEILDGEIGNEYADIIEDNANLKILGYWGGSSRNVLSTGDPIESMDDLNGFTLRLVQSPLKVDVWEAVGTIPTPVDYLETYSALQSGTVDGMENESVAVMSMNFYEPAPHITRTEHEFTVRPLFMSKETLKDLPGDLEEIIIQAAEEATVYEREVEKEANVQADKTMEEDFDVKFYSIDKEPFLAATEPVLIEFAAEMGLSELFEDIKSSN